MKIEALRVRDFKRIRELNIEADRGIIILGGKNGAGKSSALDAITAALTGGKAIPPSPVREGAESSEITVTLDGGIVVRRSITSKEDGSFGGSLKITTADGMSPAKAQTWLDARMGDLACDPVAFMTSPPKEQATRLRALAGVDTSALDARRAVVFEERRDIGRDGTRAAGAAESLPHFPDAPDAEVRAEVESAAPIVAEIQAATATVQAAERAADAVRHARADASRAADAMARDEEGLDRARAALAAAKDAVNAAAAKVRAAALAMAENAKAVAAAEEVRAEAAAKVIDAEPFRASLAGLEKRNAAARAEADAINLQVRANAARAAALAEAEALREQYRARTEALAGIDAERGAMLAAATFPVEGLGFDAGGGVTFQGQPLEQASGAEKLRVSMAVALAANPAIKVVLIRDASLLDDDSMAVVATMAAEADAQVWLERVGDRDPGAIVIEDGGVR